MNSKSLKRPILVMVVLFIAMLWVTASQSRTPATRPEGQVKLDQLFKKAREDFLRKDFKRAAENLRKGEDFVKQEAGRAAGESKQTLTASAQELGKLAQRVEKRTIRSVKQLDPVFVRAHHALARYYQEKASESWTQKAMTEAEHYLRLSAVYLENALTRAGHRIEAESAAAIEKAKQAGKKMEKVTDATAAELRKEIDAIRKEIDKAAQKIESLHITSSSVSVSEKGEGSADLSTAIMRVANRILPAVVYIEVTESREVENPFFPFENSPFFRRFFGVPNTPRRFKQEIQGLGSGMILDKEGHILTNYHLAGGATKMEITLADGSKHPGKLLGGDPKTDLAVVQIQVKESLPHVTFGDSDKLEIGEWVVAIGAPRALEKTVTHGIISAKNRTGITGPKSQQEFLQTDAPINPGNSGGPLLNLRGEVIGVNAAIATESGGFEGIGFTIPSNTAVRVAKDLIGRRSRPK